MDRFDAIRMGLVRPQGMGSLATDLIGGLVSNATTVVKALQQKKAAEDAADAAEKAAKAQAKVAQAQTAAAKAQAQVAAQASAQKQASGFTRYIPYIAIAILVLGVGTYFFTRRDYREDR